MDGNRRDSGCRPFFAHAVIRNLSGERRVFADESHRNATCPVGGGFSRKSDIKCKLVRWETGSHGRVTAKYNLSGGRRVFTDE